MSFDVSLRAPTDFDVVLSVPSGTGEIKAWSGSAWVTKPVKAWSGSAWVTKPLKRWNGSEWLTV